jgi:hypothetical protein
MLYQIKITLKNIDPPIWRRVLVPDTLTLFDLHHIIQVAMGWDNSHLHAFDIQKQRYSDSCEDEWDDVKDETKTRLSNILLPKMKFTYEYDYGDSWYHELRVEKKLDEDARSETFCLGGERACPPEDCGGVYGYSDMLKTLAHPKTKACKELREWLGSEYDPEEFDIGAVNAQLLKFMAPKRKRAKRSDPGR